MLSVCIPRELPPYLVVGLERLGEKSIVLQGRITCGEPTREDQIRRELLGHFRGRHYSDLTLELGALTLLVLQSALEYVTCEDPTLATPALRAGEKTLCQLQALTDALVPIDDGLYLR